MSWEIPWDTGIKSEWNNIVTVKGRCPSLLCVCVCVFARVHACARVRVCTWDLTYFSLSFIYFMQRIAEYSLIYLVSTSTLLEMHYLSIVLKCWNNSVLILCKIGLLPLNQSDNNTQAFFGISQVVLISLMLLTNQRLPVRILDVTIKLKKAWNIKTSLLVGEGKRNKSKRMVIHESLPACHAK